MIPVPTDREEGIMPYEPELKLAPSFHINYNMSIPGVEEIKVALTRLESTCIVFTISPTDLFWTRVQPSNMFDVLKGINYTLNGIDNLYNAKLSFTNFIIFKIKTISITE